MESFGASQPVVKVEEPADVLEGQTIGVNSKLGSLDRQLQLRIRIQEAEETISKQPEHAHIDAWKERLEKDKQALSQNEAALDEKFKKLLPEEEASLREEYEQTLATILKYRDTMAAYKGDYESLNQLGEEKRGFEDKLIKLEERLKG